MNFIIKELKKVFIQNANQQFNIIKNTRMYCRKSLFIDCGINSATKKMLITYLASTKQL